MLNMLNCFAETMKYISIPNFSALRWPASWSLSSQNVGYWLSHIFSTVVWFSTILELIYMIYKWYQPRWWETPSLAICGMLVHIVVIMELLCSYYKHAFLYPPGIILCMCPANETQRYIVTLSLIGWAHSQNDIWHHHSLRAWPIDFIYRSKIYLVYIRCDIMVKMPDGCLHIWRVSIATCIMSEIWSYTMAIMQMTHTCFHYGQDCSTACAFTLGMPH